ncbi:hypothetical protein BGX26_001802 [Mortierella sp. AD094]|nr:hypothetical protein BGX26_001802 [Mortierella sp. AD094]
MADSTPTTPFNSPVKPPTKLTRTQTPVPEAFLSHFTFREATLKGATVANTLLNKDLSLSSPLCRDINTDSTMQDDNEDDDSDDSDNDGEQEEEQEEEDRADGRERTLSVIDLDSAPSSLVPLSNNIFNNNNPGSPRALAMQADKKSKRVRVDASATNIKKTVRFDESRNTKHPHYSDDKRFFNQLESSIAFRTPTSASATRPVVSALIRRQSSSSSSSPVTFNSTRTSFSPFTFGNNPTNNANNTEDASSNQFSLSLENTSQEVMDFASSLSRLMGGSSADNSNNSSTDFLYSLGSPSSSPMRSFSPSFQNSPPSPVRPAFMSAYSPPMASSLSSCWSPTLESDKDEDEVMSSSSQLLSPPRPVSRGQSSSSSAKFTPRRPRISSPMRPQQQQSSSSAGVRPRFPSMLKREASNASFLDNYPSSLVADDEPSSPLVPVTPLAQLPDLQNNNNSIVPNHAAIAAAVLNMPSLTKSVSDVSNSKSSFQFDTTTSSSQHKRSSSWDFGQQQQQNTNAGAPLAPLSFGAPLFPMAPNKTQADNSIFPTPPDSQRPC